METNDNWNNYFYEGTNVLKNKLGITDKDELKKKEKEISLEKLTCLYLEPIKGNFDAKHLCAIHKYIFGDLFDFAGEYRNVNIGKTHTSAFTDYHFISSYLDQALEDIDKKIAKEAFSDLDYAERLAFCYHRLIDIHPFREGNGRAIREFMREYVKSRNIFFENKDYELDFSSKDIDREQLFLGTVLPISQIGVLTIQFMNALKITQKKDNVKRI